MLNGGGLRGGCRGAGFSNLAGVGGGSGIDPNDNGGGGFGAGGAVFTRDGGSLTIPSSTSKQNDTVQDDHDYTLQREKTANLSAAEYFSRAVRAPSISPRI